MSLKTTLRKAVKAAFKALDDVPKKCVYKSVTGTTVRDHANGTLIRVTQDYPLPMVVFARFQEKDTDKDPALLTDMKMIFPRDDLPALPKVSDTVLDEDGVTWAIVKRLTDPAALVTILQVRTS